MRAILAFITFLLLGAAVHAAETITYTYDARGRLIKVVHTGTVNNGVSACYTYDKADNRSNVTVATSGCSSTAPSCGVSYAVSDASADEGVALVFTVTKTGSTASSCSINYATADGTAVAPGDYTAASGTLTFAASETSKTVSIATKDNLVAESTEQMYLNLSTATGGAAISDSQGVGTIIDNDDPNPCPLC